MIEKINIQQALNLDDELKKANITWETVFRLCKIEKTEELDVRQYGLLMMILSKINLEKGE